MRAVADSGFIVAVMNVDDRWHERCLEVYRQFNTIFIPQTTLTEVAYILRREAGIRVVSAFLRQLPLTRYLILSLEDNDLQRSAELLDKYSDTRIDFVDASVCACAERLKLNTILTIDRRDFQIMRPSHVDYFDLLPQPQ